jgi:hypothetical protein
VESGLQELRASGCSYVRNTDYASRVLGWAAPAFNFKFNLTLVVSMAGVEGISDLGAAELGLEGAQAHGRRSFAASGSFAPSIKLIQKNQLF